MSLAELTWNQYYRLHCKTTECTVAKCYQWKRVRNVLCNFTEGWILLFSWLRSQIFYCNPLVAGKRSTSLSVQLPSLQYPPLTHDPSVPPPPPTHDPFRNVWHRQPLLSMSTLPPTCPGAPLCPSLHTLLTLTLLVAASPRLLHGQTQLVL